MTTESDLFIASNLESLSDFLKTELSMGKRIHCTFPKRIYERDVLLTKSVEARNITKITFTKARR